MKNYSNKYQIIKTTILFSFILIFTPPVFANNISHTNSMIQIDAKKYYHERYQKQLNKSNDTINIIPLQERDSNDPGLDHVVFGFLPWWMLNTVNSTIDLDLLTHIAIFDFACDSFGNFPTDAYGDTTAYPVGWPNAWVNILNRAHNKGVKLLISISSLEFDKDIMHNILHDTTAGNNLIKNTAKLIKRYNLDGVILNFEHPYDDDKGEVMNLFTQKMNDYLKENIGSEQVLTFAAPPINWGKRWNLPGLIEATDFLVVMGYDFWWSGSEDTGPCAPIFGGNYNILKTLDDTETGYGYCDHSKLVLVYPYYGFTWEVNESEKSIPHATPLAPGTHIVYSSIVSKYQNYGVFWDPATNEPFTYYKSGENWYQSWCDNTISLNNKQGIIIDYGLTGTGMWALGYDSAYDDLWNIYRENYYVFSNSLNMDNFESGKGRFYRKPTFSGSTQGISIDSYTEISSETAYDESNSLKLTLFDNASSSLNWETRLLSSTGRPNKNAPIPHGYYLKFAAKTNKSGVQIAVLIDDREGELEMSPRITIADDNKWNEYCVRLDNSTAWDSYENGNASLDSSFVTLDALLICSDDKLHTRTIYLDGIKAEETGKPSEPGESINTLFPAYPNPFNKIMNLNYEIRANAHVIINIFDLQGRKIKCLIDKEQSTGSYNILWNASTYASGIYFIQMKIDGDVVAAQKATLLK